MKHEDLTHSIIGCGMKVHSQLGFGFQELHYQRALALEFNENGIAFSREVEMEIYYGEKLIGKRRVDFLVENKIVVELKARSQLEPAHFVQAMNYLEAMKLEIGLLINFGAKSLEFKRLHNKKMKSR
jgi:GxxExxY protein